MKCGGNEEQVCGGSDAVSIYGACAGGACTGKEKREGWKRGSVEAVRAEWAARK